VQKKLISLVIHGPLEDSGRVQKCYLIREKIPRKEAEKEGRGKKKDGKNEEKLMKFLTKLSISELHREKLTTILVLLLLLPDYAQTCASKISSFLPRSHSKKGRADLFENCNQEIKEYLFSLSFDI
jgi:hypothetical protein